MMFLLQCDKTCYSISLYTITAITPSRFFRCLLSQRCFWIFPSLFLMRWSRCSCFFSWLCVYFYSREVLVDTLVPLCDNLLQAYRKKNPQKGAPKTSESIQDGRNSPDLISGNIDSPTGTSSKYQQKKAKKQAKKQAKVIHWIQMWIFVLPLLFNNLLYKNKYKIFAVFLASKTAAEVWNKNDFRQSDITKQRKWWPK